MRAAALCCFWRTKKLSPSSFTYLPLRHCGLRSLPSVPPDPQPWVDARQQGHHQPSAELACRTYTRMAPTTALSQDSASTPSTQGNNHNPTVAHVPPHTVPAALGPHLQTRSRCLHHHAHLAQRQWPTAGVPIACEVRGKHHQAAHHRSTHVTATGLCIRRGGLSR